MSHKILTIFLFTAFFCATSCQDIEPQPLFPDEGKTTTIATATTTTTEAFTTEATSTTQANEISITTDRPTTDAEKPVTTISTPWTYSTSTAATTVASTISSTTEMTTESLTTSTIPSTATPSTTQSLEIQTTSTAAPPNDSTTPITYPSITSRPVQRCYFRKQQSRPKFYWTCEGPKWLYSMECFQCCQSDNYAFAGCNQVHYSYCEQYNPY